MDKSQSEEDLKFAEFFNGRYQVKRVILSRSNYKLFEVLDTSQRNARFIIQQFTSQKLLSDSELSLHRETIHTLQSLESQNLFNIVDSKVEETQCLLALECFDSLNLEDYSESVPGRSSLLLVFFQVILALNELHRKAILHVNLRPDNIFVGIGGLVKLGGISLLKSSDCTESSRSFFNPTPGYSAPEVWESGASLNETADVYSLGSLLYFCVTEGQHPTRIISNSKIPQKFRSIIQKSREINPEDRQASVGLFEDELLKILSQDDESSQIENLEDAVSDESSSVEEISKIENTSAKETLEIPSVEKEDLESEADPGAKPSKELIKKLGIPFKSIAEDFKEAWQDARQEILQETRDLVKQKLVRSNTKKESNESQKDKSIPSDNKKLKTKPNSKGIVADAKRIKELRKKEKAKVDLPPERNNKSISLDSKAPKIEQSSTTLAEKKSEGDTCVKQVSILRKNLEAIKHGFEGIGKNLSLPVIFGALLIFGISTSFILNVDITENEKPQTSTRFANEPKIKLLGEILWREDELSDWKPFKDQTQIKGTRYLFAKDGDTELRDEALDFTLEMKKGCELHLLQLKGSKTGIKNRIELGVIEGEFIIHSNSSRVFVEIVDNNVRVFGRGVIFKVTGRSGNSRYYVKKGSLSVQLPNSRKLARVSPGRMIRISNGVIENKKKFDKNLQDF